MSFFLITPAALSEQKSTIIGNSTFPAEEEDSFRWRCTNSTGELYNIGDLVQFTAEKIYNDTFNGKMVMNVNYSLDEYDRLGGQWRRAQNNRFYMAYNYTQNFLNVSEISYRFGALFLIPIPKNFTLVANAIESAGYLTYTINGTTSIILDYGNTTTVELTIDDNGLTTSFEEFVNDTSVYRWDYVPPEEPIVIVPFGHPILIAIVVGVISIVLVGKSRSRIE